MMRVWAQVRVQSHVPLGGYHQAPRLNQRWLRTRWRGADLSDLPPEWLSSVSLRKGDDYEIVPISVSAGLLETFVDLPYKPASYVKFANRYGLLGNGPTLTEDRRINLLDWRGVTRAQTLIEWALFASHLRCYLGQSSTGEPEFVTRLRGPYARRVCEDEAREPRYARAHGEAPARMTAYGSADYLAAVVRCGLLPNIEPDATGDGPQLVMQATTLQAGLALRALWHHRPGTFVTGVERRSCVCGKTFLVGPGYGRRDKRFCNAACRDLYTKRDSRAKRAGRMRDGD